jgi:hypothetical protein
VTGGLTQAADLRVGMRRGRPEFTASGEVAPAGAVELTLSDAELARLDAA